MKNESTAQIQKVLRNVASLFMILGTPFSDVVLANRCMFINILCFWQLKKLNVSVNFNQFAKYSIHFNLVTLKVSFATNFQIALPYMFMGMYVYFFSTIISNGINANVQFLMIKNILFCPNFQLRSILHHVQSFLPSV